jgi:hypothetical protein
MSDSKLPGCFKYGCIGCLSVAALGVAAIFLIGAINIAYEPDEPRPEKAQLAQDLPEAPAPPTLPYPSADSPSLPESLTLPDAADTVRAGRVVLDLSMGEFIIRPGPPGEPIRIDADYDAASFVLTEEYTASDDGTWTYDVSFGARRGFLGMLFRGGVQEGDNRIELTIPRGYPVDIVGKIGIGESEIDLGGLWIRNVDLELGTGDHFLEFREPLPFPMGDFAVDSSIGEVEVRNLGAASPRSVVVGHGLGELLVDLHGPWRRDAEVDVRCGVGECRLWLPDTARVDMKSAKIGIGESHVERPDDEDLPADAPTLTINMRGGLGDLRVEN